MSLTHQGGKLSICPTPQTPVLDQTAFEALTYTDIPEAITAPAMRVTQNTLTQNTLAGDISSVQGGFRNGETTEILLEHSEITSPGPAALETAAKSSNYYAVKYELNNSLGTNGSTIYALVFVAGGGGPLGGGGEDFANRSYSLTPTSQQPVEVAAA